MSGCTYKNAPFSHLWRLPPLLPRFFFCFFPQCQAFWAPLYISVGRAGIISVSIHFSLLSYKMCDFFSLCVSLLHYLSISISFTLSLSPRSIVFCSLSFPTLFFFSPLSSSLPGNRVRDSATLTPPLLSDIKQGGFVDYQGKLIMTW